MTDILIPPKLIILPSTLLKHYPDLVSRFVELSLSPIDNANTISGDRIWDTGKWEMTVTLLEYSLYYLMSKLYVVKPWAPYVV